MIDTSNDRDALVEAITREVLAALGIGAAAADSNDPCAGCLQSCAAQCATKVRSLMESGADRIEYHGDANDVPLDLARYIDHTLLKPDASAADIDKLCDEAAEHHFASVCVNPTWVRRAANRLRDTDVAVASVIGFPFGATPSDVKAFEARRAVRDGAREIDMVINIGALKSGDHDLVRSDIGRGQRRLPRGRRHQQGHHRGGAAHRRGEDRSPAASPSEAKAPTSSRPPPASPRAAPPSTTSR